MWTHLSPYRPSDLTLASIEEHGRMSLYRSIRLNNVVAFIGSGLSVPYGGPSWSDLATIMVICVVQNLNKLLGLSHDRSIIVKIGNPLLQLLSQKEWDASSNDPNAKLKVDLPDASKYGDSLTTIMALCEDILMRIDKLAPALDAHKSTRAELFKVLRYNSSQSAMSHFLNGFYLHMPQAKRLKIIDELAKKPTILDRVKFYQSLLQQLEASGATMFDSFGPEDVENLPFIEASTSEYHSGLHTVYVLHDMGIRRFATLNYDLHVERRFVEKLDRATVAQPEEMDGLLYPERHPPQTAPAMDVQFRTSTGWSVRSVNLTKSTATDFLRFAVHEDKQETTVFHLHGRVDDPDSAIFTETDYRRRYLSKSGPGVVADEAVKVLYNGNDILFIGTGLKEEDVLGPLRSIMMQNRKPDTDARSTIALMPASFGAFASDGTVRGQSEAQAEDARQAIHLRQKYGINVIYYGRKDPAFRDMMQLLNAVRQSLGKGRKFFCPQYAAIASEILRALPADASRNIKDELSALEVLTSREDAEGFGGDPDGVKRRCAQELVTSIANRVLARALSLELKGIHEKSIRWEREWRLTPSERKVRFFVQPVGRDPSLRYPVWIRHRPRTVHTSDKLDESAPWLEAKRLARISIAQAAERVGPQSRRRTVILRVSAARGRGKGAFSRLLFDRRRQVELFGRPGYAGAFIAHMSFSMEFSSVIRALTRFVAGRLAELTTAHDPEAPARWEEQPSLALEAWPDLRLTNIEREEPFRLHRLELLRRLLRAFDHVAKDKPDVRLFICLSGVNRLTDAKGDAHSPMHRAFFRLLSGSGEHHPGGGPGDPPIDLVLVAGRPDSPIAYLSEECPKDQTGGASPFECVSRSTSKRSLKIWPTLPAFGWRDRLIFAGVDLDSDDPYLKAFERLVSDPGPEGSPNPYSQIRKILWNSLALSVWSYLAFQTVIDRGKPADDQARDWLTELTSAATTGADHGVVEVISNYHDLFIRREFYRYFPDLKGKIDLQISTLKNLIVQHLVLFFLPVRINDLFGCPEVRVGAEALATELSVNENCNKLELSARAFQVLRHVLKLLARSGLVIEIAPAGAEAEEAAQTPGVDPWRDNCGYVIHDQLREYVALKLQLFVPDGGDRNHFQVSSYTEQPRDTPTPSWDHFKRVSNIVESHVNGGQYTMSLFYRLDSLKRKRAALSFAEQGGPRSDAIERDIAAVVRQIKDRLNSPDIAGPYAGEGSTSAIECIPQRMRADYAILRGGFSIGALSRLSPDDAGAQEGAPFDKYREWLRRLINAGVGLHYVGDGLNAALQGQLDAYAAAKTWQAPPKRFRQAFYIDEIAWLLNERGLVSFAQGRLDDAVMHYDRALAIMAHQPSELTNDPAYHSAERRIGLNRAIALIERGDLALAQKNLTDYRDQCAATGKSTFSSTLLYAQGYIALCKHISGNIGDVVEQYGNVIRESQRTDRLRAVAIFSRHLSDAWIQLNDLSKAREHLNIAMTAASHAEQQDVLNLTVVSHAKLLLLEGEPKAALERTLQAEAYGARMGLYSVRAQALSVRARVRLRQGDVEGAGGAATEAIAICKRHGMKLRQFSAMLTYAEALYARGEEGMARSVVEFARDSAEQMRLQSKVARARRLLAQFDFNAPLSPGGRPPHDRDPNGW